MANPKKRCNWPYAAQFTEEAKEHRISKCMEATMNEGHGVLGDSCEQYFAGLSSTTETMASCTSTDFQKECSRLRQSWTVKGVREYCTAINDANDAFWMKNHPPWKR